MCSTFLSLFQNGSNLVESFLNIIRSYAETPGIFDFKKDQLLYSSLPSKSRLSEGWLNFYGLSPGGLANGKKGKDYQGHVFWDMVRD